MTQPITSPVVRSGRLDRAMRELRIALPDPKTRLEQDEQWFLVKTDRGWREYRLHDYDEVFLVPGLYERITYDIFECTSPRVVADLLASELREQGADPAGLTVLDLGAGNGIMAEELRLRGVERFVGLDLSPSASIAAERDRPGLYDAYIVGDVTDLPPEEAVELEARDVNAMTCVAALGFGDIPPEAFVAAWNRVSDDGWVAFNIKRDFLEHDDGSGFARLIRAMIAEGAFEVCRRKVYVHRIDSVGEPLEYVALVGRKRTAASWPDGAGG